MSDGKVLVLGWFLVTPNRSVWFLHVPSGPIVMTICFEVNPPEVRVVGHSIDRMAHESALTWTEREERAGMHMGYGLFSHEVKYDIVYDVYAELTSGNGDYPNGLAALLLSDVMRHGAVKPWAA